LAELTSEFKDGETMSSAALTFTESIKVTIRPTRSGVTIESEHILVMGDDVTQGTDMILLDLRIWFKSKCVKNGSNGRRTRKENGPKVYLCLNWTVRFCSSIEVQGKVKAAGNELSRATGE
jgi:hypothetical protein